MKRVVFAVLTALLLLPASAMARDRNHDRLPDGWERANHLSLKVKQTRRDQDSDGIRNLAEFRHGLNPRDDDSDGDGTEDGDESGQIVSFDAASGDLVIALLDGSQLSGKVTDATEIECGAADDQSDEDEGDHEHGGHHGDDDNSAVMSHDGEDDDGGDGDGSCSTDQLVPGAKVHEAELEVTSAGKAWDEIELV